MFKQVLKTLALGFASGLACAAGGWMWKNNLEKKATEKTQEFKNQQEERLRKEKENN